MVPLSTNVTSQRGIESLFMSPASIILMCFTLYSYCEGRHFAILLKFVSSDIAIITKSLRRCQSKLPRGNSLCGKQNWRHHCSGCAVIGPILARARFRIGNRKKRPGNPGSTRVSSPELGTVLDHTITSREWEDLFWSASMWIKASCRRHTMSLLLTLQTSRSLGLWEVAGLIPAFYTACSLV